MEQEEISQQVPQIRTTPYQSPMNQYGGAIMFLTNPESELFKLELTLRGEMVDKDGNPKKMSSPLLNDTGIASIIGITQTIVNQVTVMSILDKREIPQLMDFLSDTLAKDLMINRIRYKLNFNDRDKVFFNVLSFAFICMKRAGAEGINDKKFWRGSVQEINTNTQLGNKQNGLAARLGWGKK